MRLLLYGVMIACLIVAGGLDAYAGEWKAATTAWLFATANAVIFFWR